MDCLTIVIVVHGRVLDLDVWVERLQLSDEGGQACGGRGRGASEDGEVGERGEESEVEVGVP